MPTVLALELFLCVLIVALVAGNPDPYVERGGWRWSTGLPSLSSSCGSSASMASMVAEGGGGGEQVTPDKAMQMQNAASLQGSSGSARGTRVDRQRSQTQRSATCISTERVSHKTDARDGP